MKDSFKKIIYLFFFILIHLKIYTVDSSNSFNYLNSFGYNNQNYYTTKWEELIPNEIIDTDGLIVKRKQIINFTKEVFGIASNYKLIDKILEKKVHLEIKIKEKEIKDSKIEDELNMIMLEYMKIIEKLEKIYKDIAKLINKVTILIGKENSKELTETKKLEAIGKIKVIYSLSKKFIKIKDILDDIYFDFVALEKNLDNKVKELIQFTINNTKYSINRNKIRRNNEKYNLNEKYDLKKLNFFSDKLIKKVKDIFQISKNLLEMNNKKDEINKNLTTNIDLLFDVIKDIEDSKDIMKTNHEKEERITQIINHIINLLSKS